MKVEKAVQFMIGIANDDKHGYSQLDRGGNPDYDCSSLVITAFSKAGFNVKNATYTGNMKNVFLRAGFKDVTKNVNLKSGSNLKRGDILLNEIYHVAVYIGDSKMVHARSDERGGIVGRLKGDQTGNEISITPYYLYRKGWDCVLRYEEKIDTDVLDKKGEVKTMSEKEKGYAVQAINKLAELKLLNSPDVHIKNIDKSNWALWVMLAKLAERR
ncbi:NlpC/P60 family protein [Peptoanaerobacter stomatis]